MHACACMCTCVRGGGEREGVVKKYRRDCIYIVKDVQKCVENMQHSHGYLTHGMYIYAENHSMQECPNFKWLVGGFCLKTPFTRPSEVEVVEVPTEEDTWRWYRQQVCMQEALMQNAVKRQ